MAHHINLSTFGNELADAYNKVVSSSTSTNWALFGYDKNTNDLRVTGTGGLFFPLGNSQKMVVWKNCKKNLKTARHNMHLQELLTLRLGFRSLFSSIGFVFVVSELTKVTVFLSAKRRLFLRIQTTSRQDSKYE